MRKLLGVSLLEVLLVLVVASLVLVMSIRYYQSASTSTKANDAARTLASAMTTLDNYISTGGTTLANAGTLPSGTWGGTLTVTGSAASYTLAFPSVPSAACPQLKALATQGGTSTRVTNATPCGPTTTTLSFTIVQ